MRKAISNINSHNNKVLNTIYEIIRDKMQQNLTNHPQIRAILLTTRRLIAKSVDAAHAQINALAMEFQKNYIESYVWGLP